MQILLYIKRAAAGGIIKDGDELPSRRVLSTLLGVNPNTVQKAYRILEEEGLIRSHSGAKSCMVLDEARSASIRKQLMEQEVLTMISAMKRMGVEKDCALKLIDSLWK